MAEDPTDKLQPDKTKKENSWTGCLIQSIAIFLWLYAITNILIYDVDSFLENTFPVIGWMIRFKFPFVLGSIALVWIFTKSNQMLLWFLYIVLYPALVILWKIPRFIWKQRSWNLTFAYVNALLSSSRSLKGCFLTLALIIIDFLLVFQSSSPSLLWMAVSISVIIIIGSFIHRFVFIFRPSDLYQVHSKITSGILRFGKKTFTVEKSIKEIPQESRIQAMNDEQRTKWAGNLQFAIILNRGCNFFSRKLQDYQRSKFTAAFYVLNFLMLTSISILSFSLINYSVYKIEPSNFALTVKPGFFIFFYYSANTIFGHGVGEVVATSTISRTFFLAELLFTFLLVVILITLWSSVKNAREADEIGETILDIRRQGDEMEGFIRQEYGLSVREAITCLVALNMAGMIKVIDYLSQYEEDRSSLE